MWINLLKVYIAYCLNMHKWIWVYVNTRDCFRYSTLQNLSSSRQHQVVYSAWYIVSITWFLRSSFVSWIYFHKSELPVVLSNTDALDLYQMDMVLRFLQCSDITGGKIWYSWIVGSLMVFFTTTTDKTTTFVCDCLLLLPQDQDSDAFFNIFLLLMR